LRPWLPSPAPKANKTEKGDLRFQDGQGRALGWTREESNQVGRNSKCKAFYESLQKYL
jgi:hypothetical protein